MFLYQPDSLGQVPEVRLIGEVFLHSPTGISYKVTGYTWLGDLDEWGVVHVSDIPEDQPCTRSLSNFNGVSVLGKSRFKRLSGTKGQVPAVLGGD